MCLGFALLAAAAAARDYPPEVPPPKPIVLPVPRVLELPNGLKVVVIERRSLPLVTLRLVVKSGAEADAPGLAGTAQLVAGLLSQGTARRSAWEIADAVDSAGGTLETGADWDNSYVALTVLSDHTEQAFDLVADMVLHPRFAREELERRRKQTLSALEVLYEDPSYLADTVFDRLIFAGTPYSHPADGTPETVSQINQANLRGFHAQNYRPGNSILAVVGDVKDDEVSRLAEKSFGGWQGATGKRGGEPILPTATQEQRLVVIDKPDAVQTEIRAGNLAVRRASDDYYALTVANQVLGGPAANRHLKALRTRQGLTYGASSELVCQETAGDWVAKTSTRTAETIRSLNLVLEEMKRLHDDRVSGAELRTAQSYLIGHLALEFETSDDMASQMLELMVYHLPLDYWNRFPEEIQALGAENVSSVTRHYLDRDRSVIVLVGNAGAFKKELKRFGIPVIIPLQDLDLASPDLQRAVSVRAQ
ncbi:MAG: insulinase family protein [Acidobacteriia bacterium]|nr:insulinase family protein [Terriglobia bacterium]